MTRVGVLVPAHRRPDDLRRCLSALLKTHEAPDLICVVRRRDDESLIEVLRQYAFATEVIVDEPGTIAALHVGLRYVAPFVDVIATIDDDAAPHADWVSRLKRHYDDASVCAVGGRDIVHLSDNQILTGDTADVGLFDFTLRRTGGHHLGSGPARDVQVLKGVNFSIRVEHWRLPTGLRGTGAQVGHDLASSLAVAVDGGRVVYDPSLVVDHFPAVRFDADQRNSRTAGSAFDAAFNITYVACSLVPRLAFRTLVYAVVVGDRQRVGVLRAAVAILKGDTGLARLAWPCIRGTSSGYRRSRRRPLLMVPILSPGDGL